MSNGNKPAVDPNLIRQFLQTQSQQALNEAEKIKVEKARVDHDANYAKDVVGKQFELLKRKPYQDRLTVITYASIAFVFVLLYAGVIIYLTIVGKDDLVTTILTWSGRILALVVAFILGRLSNAKKSKNDPKDAAEVVE